MVYNVNISKARGGLGFGAIFLFAGLLFFGVMMAIGVSNLTKKNSFDGEVKATEIHWDSHYDSDSGTMYSPVYSYEVEGVTYNCSSRSSSSSKSGAKGIVYYDTNNPSNCMTDFDNKTSFIIFIFLFLPLIFIIVGANQMKKAINNGKKAKYLATSGVLVKGAPYEIIDTGMAVNNRKIKAFAITYTFPDGQTKEIKSQGVFDHVLRDSDGLCDFLYDPNDYNNYYIDLEINPTGIGSPNIVYYNDTQQVVTNPINNNPTMANPQNDIYAQNGYNPNYYPQDGYNPQNKF